MENKKEKKIGIISLNTHTFYHNYGAIMHSYAFQTFLNKNKIENEIIDYTPPMLEGWNLDAPWKSLLSKKFGIKKSFLKYFVLQIPYKIRKDKIDNFIKTKMILSNDKYTHSSLKNADLKYETMICESDVIWSNGFWDDAYFLAFENMKNSKKIAYSPSMADCNLSEDKLKKLPNLLDKLDYISGRESYECEILKKYTKKPVKHVCDPVFLLEQNDYNPIISPRLIKKPYLLLYLPADNNKYLRKCAYKYAKKHSLKVIEIDSRLNVKLTHKSIITAGIEEFLSLIKYADVCFTNSFHAVCFCIIFQREFYTFTRNTRGKIEDILKTLNLNERFIENNFEEKKAIDYTSVNLILEEWKKTCKEWIINAILDNNTADMEEN